MICAVLIAASLALAPIPGALRAEVAAQNSLDAPDAGAAPASFLLGVAPGFDLAGMQNLAASQGFTVVRAWPEFGLVQVQTSAAAGSGDAATAAAQLSALGELPNLRFAEPDYRVYAAGAYQATEPVRGAESGQQEAPPNDPLVASQWAVERIGVLQAWQVGIGASSVSIAVIDSGVDLQHPDLTGANLWVNGDEDRGRPNVDDDGNGYVDDIHGWDWVDQDNSPGDLMGHGTHVAGTIAAGADNQIGIAGLGRELSIMPLRILDGFGSGYVSDLVDALYYARAGGARVVNLSLVLPFDSSALGEAVSALRQAGILVVAAAGNTGRSVLWPARYADVMAVAATDRNDRRAWFSSFGPEIDIAAPGMGILSTHRNGEYRSLDGTSMATPHVSALAGLIWSLRPDFRRDDVFNLLRSSAVDVNAAFAPGDDIYLGAGRISFGAAVWKASEMLRLDPVAAPAAVVKPAADLRYQVQVVTPASGATASRRVQGAVVEFLVSPAQVNAGQIGAQRVAVTDRNGVATIQLTAPAASGHYATRARVGDTTLDLPVEVASGPGSMSITIDRNRFEVSEPDLGNTATFRVEVRNAEGELYEAQYSLQLFTEVGMFGDQSQEATRTVSGGILVGAYFPGTVADTGRLVARGEDIAADTELVVEPGVPVALYVPPVWDQQRFDDNGEIRLTLAAVLRDQFGNLVRDGTVVEFTSSVGAINPPSALTVDGRATAEFLLTEVTFDPINVWVRSPGSGAFNWVEIPALMPRLYLPMLHVR